MIIDRLRNLEPVEWFIGAIMVAVVGFIGVSAYLTITAPTEGYVLDKNHDEESWSSLTSTDANGNVTTSQQYHPESWSFWLCESPPGTEDNTCGWRSVSSGMYESTDIGEYWTKP